MIKVIILIIGAAGICNGRPAPDGHLHVVYSKMLSEVGMLQAEPRSGVAYVYSITPSESLSPIESAPLKASKILISQDIDIQDSSKQKIAASKVVPFKSTISSSKQLEEKKTQFSPIEALDPKVNETGFS